MNIEQMYQIWINDQQMTQPSNWETLFHMPVLLYNDLGVETSKVEPKVFTQVSSSS